MVPSHDRPANSKDFVLANVEKQPKSAILFGVAIATARGARLKFRMYIALVVLNEL